MLNSEAITAIAKKLSLTKTATAKALSHYRKMLRRELLSTQSVRIHGLGTLSFRRVRGKVGNNKKSSAYKVGSFRLQKTKK